MKKANLYVALLLACIQASPALSQVASAPAPTPAPAPPTSGKLSLNLGNDWSLLPMARQDWTDILDNGGSTSAAGNIQGAAFSFTRNGEANTETWSAVGAGILSFAYLPVTSDLSGWNIIQGALGPTAAINKVEGSTASNNIDHLYFGLGQGIQVLHGNKPGAYDPGAFTFGFAERAGFIYDTDSNLRASLPGGIFELEPEVMYHWVNPNAVMPWAALGLNNRLGYLSDGSALVLVQLRAWFHLEGGDLQQSGTNWNVVPGSFLRLGPECRGQITIPKLKNFSISGEYDYIPTVSGPVGRNYLYTIGGSLPLFDFAQSSPANSRGLKLTATYTKGGLVLSKQVVDIFTLGLSVTY